MKRAVLLLAGVALVAGAGLEAAAPGPQTGMLATPPGITLEPLGVSQGYEWNKQTATYLPREQIAFATPEGMTLYTSDADAPGRSACIDECAKAWPPALAAKDAKPIGRWSVIARPDGNRQWAYSGRPLYASAKDVDPGSVYGNSPARFGMRRKDARGNPTGGMQRMRDGKIVTPDEPLPAGWKVALAFPVTDVMLPVGVRVREVHDAVSLALVDHRNMTIYAFAGDARKEKSSGSDWIPVEAPQLSEAIGDFTAVVRPDGIKQWAFKGYPLYTFAHDLVPGDANGVGVDPRRSVASVVNHFVPSNVTVQTTLARGNVLATDKGQTLYRREAHIDQTGGGHNLRRGQPIRPAVGREIGVANVRCDAACRREWHPYAAPDGAQPQGQWTIAVHTDGVRQWVYQGYALWTYDGDKKPGDINGNDELTYYFADMPNAASPAVRTQLADIGTPQDGGAGLYWTIAVP
jgi:predicted lipoprotein with Yx(FWY)xxD motif